MKIDDIHTAREEIMKILSNFINGLKNEEIQSEAINIERKYAGLTTINDYKKEKIVPNEVINGISFMQEIYQYGDGTYDDRESIKKAKLILKSLQ